MGLWYRDRQEPGPGAIVYSAEHAVAEGALARLVADGVFIDLFLAARNLPNVLVVEPRYADPLSLVFYKKVVVTKGAIAKLQEMFA